MEDSETFETKFANCLGITAIDTFLLGTHLNAGANCQLVNLPQPARSFVVEFLQGVNKDRLRTLCWHGIPSTHRALAWQLLLEYLPRNADLRILRKRGADVFAHCPLRQKFREEYVQTVKSLLDVGSAWPEEAAKFDPPALVHEAELRLVRADVSRRRMQSFSNNLHAHSNGQGGSGTASEIEGIDQMLQRILFVALVKRPWLGSVNGIYRIATYFVTAAFQSIAHVPKPYNTLMLTHIEADSYHLFVKFLDTSGGFKQECVQKMVDSIEGIVRRVDAPLSKHFQEQKLMMLLFAFQWLQGLMLFEFDEECSMRIVDSYLSMPGKIPEFATQIAAATLLEHSKQLQHLNFPMIMMFLQKLPPPQVDLLTSHAYVLMQLFEGSRAHLGASSTMPRHPMQPFHFWGGEQHNNNNNNAQ